jgi:hypothetical protein
MELTIKTIVMIKAMLVFVRKKTTKLTLYNTNKTANKANEVITAPDGAADAIKARIRTQTTRIQRPRFAIQPKVKAV